MSDAVFVECVFILNPRTASRARRLALAVELLRQGMGRRDVSMQIRSRFGVNRLSAWRIVDVAYDMAGDIKAPP